MWSYKRKWQLRWQWLCGASSVKIALKHARAQRTVAVMCDKSDDSYFLRCKLTDNCFNMLQIWWRLLWCATEASRHWRSTDKPWRGRTRQKEERRPLPSPPLYIWVLKIPWVGMVVAGLGDWAAVVLGIMYMGVGGRFNFCWGERSQYHYKLGHFCQHKSQREGVQSGHA